MVASISCELTKVTFPAGKAVRSSRTCAPLTKPLPKILTLARSEVDVTVAWGNSSPGTPPPVGTRTSLITTFFVCAASLNDRICTELDPALAMSAMLFAGSTATPPKTCTAEGSLQEGTQPIPVEPEAPRGIAAARRCGVPGSIKETSFLTGL